MRGKKPSLERLLAALAREQHGVVARWQLLPRGFAPDVVDRWIASGRLHRVHQGVYAVGHTRLTVWGHCMAAVLSCGPHAVLSHRSAARLWNLLSDSRRLIDVTVPGRNRRPRGVVRVHQTRNLRPDDVTVVDGIPVTSVARTLLDLAATEKAERMEQAIQRAETHRLFDLKAVEQLLERSPRHKGRRPLLDALTDVVHTVPGTRRELERLFQSLVREAGLPRPEVNTMIEGLEVDVVWRDHRLIVELDSREFHLTRRAFETDRERDAALQVAGYRVIRITWRRLMNEPDAIVRELRALLGRY
jgi:very-short-patch-repair endonuclease